MELYLEIKIIIGRNFYKIEQHYANEVKLSHHHLKNEGDRHKFQALFYKIFS